MNRPHISKNGDYLIFRNSYPDIHKTLTLLFSIYVATWYLEIGKRIEFLGNIRFEFLLGAFLGVIAILILLNQNENQNKNNDLGKYIILYFLFLAIHLPFSQDFTGSWFIFYNRIIKFSFMALFICAFIKNPFHLKIFIFMYLLVFFKIGQESFIGKITGSLVWENQGVMRLHGAPGTLYGHPSSLSGTSLITLPFVYYLFYILPWMWRVPLLVHVIFVINIVIFTGSRTGYVGFIIMCITIILKSSQKKKALFCLLIISLLSIPYIPSQYKERFRTIYSGQEKEGQSKQHRIELLEDSFRMFLEHPFGVGIGAFQAMREKELGKTQMATHCLYTEVLSEIGIVGFIIFFLLIYKTFQQIGYLEKNINEQIKALNQWLEKKSEFLFKTELIKNHIFDLQFMKAVCNSVFVFIITRLGLGVVGHDLYEIYWWFAAGLAITLFPLNNYAEKRTNEIIAAKIKE